MLHPSRMDQGQQQPGQIPYCSPHSASHQLVSCSTARLEQGGGVPAVTVISGLSEGTEVENNTSSQSLVNNSNSPGQVVLCPGLLLAVKAMRYQSGFFKVSWKHQPWSSIAASERPAAM